MFDMLKNHESGEVVTSTLQPSCSRFCYITFQFDANANNLQRYGFCNVCKLETSVTKAANLLLLI